MEYHNSTSRPTAWIHSPIKASGGPWRNTKDNSMGWDPQETNNTVLQCNQTLSSSDNPHGPGLSKWFTWSMPIYQSTQELRQSATSPTSCLDKTRYLKGDRCALRILWVRCVWHCQASGIGGRPSDHSFQRIQHMRTTCYKNQHERVLRPASSPVVVAFVCFCSPPLGTQILCATTKSTGFHPLVDRIVNFLQRA